MNHPPVGELSLAYEALELSADPGPTIGSYSAEPGSVSELRLRELATWAPSANN